jgi:cytidyltransferase-like protein
MAKVYYTDGFFDGFHCGHIYDLYQCKKLCNVLVVGIHDDEEMFLYNKYPLFSFNERYTMLKYCKYIDHMVTKVPYISEIDTLKRYKCNKFVYAHNDKNINLENTITYNKMKGISTENLLYRIYSLYNKQTFSTNLDYIYLYHIFNKMRNDSISTDDHDAIYVHHNWDLFNSYHIKYLLELKAIYPSHKIICCVDDYDNGCVYNHLERSIILCGISLIDKVLLYSEYNKLSLPENVININVSKELDEHTENLIKNIMDSNLFIKNKISSELTRKNYYKKLEDTYLKTGKYFDIIKNQYNVICDFLNNIEFNENDIVIFDIDEVCLTNLMYINDFVYVNLYDNYDNVLFNLKNGYNPLIKECQCVFDLLHSKNIKYSFITGRRDYIRKVTEENLKLVGLDKYIHLYTCPDDYKEHMNTFKTQCRIEISKKYNIICSIGDQASDISGIFTGMPFLIFNPFYLTQ